jgi:hypothetical protein
MSFELNAQHSGRFGISDNVPIIANTVYKIRICMDVNINGTFNTDFFHFPPYRLACPDGFKNCSVSCPGFSLKIACSCQNR